MKVVQTGTAHSISFIPRFYPTLDLVVSLYNEADRSTGTPANTYATSNGYTTVNFTYTFVEKDRFQIKITEGSEVVYRGKILVTDQTPQDYKITNGIYVYE
jgi:hypothetical protein